MTNTNEMMAAFADCTKKMGSVGTSVCKEVSESLDKKKEDTSGWDVIISMTKIVDHVSDMRHSCIENNVKALELAVSGLVSVGAYASLGAFLKTLPAHIVDAAQIGGLDAKKMSDIKARVERMKVFGDMKNAEQEAALKNNQ